MQEELNKALAVLKNGGTLLYPTDTVWGIGCNALDANAIKKVLEIKERPKNKNFIILLADPQDVFKYTEQAPQNIIELLNSFSRPTTVIYKQAKNLPEILPNKQDGSIGMRVTTDNFCRELIKQLGAPLVSSSANISGEPSPANFKDISESIKSRVDYIVGIRQNENRKTPPSKIIKIKEDGELLVLRP